MEWPEEEYTAVRDRDAGLDMRGEPRPGAYYEGRPAPVQNRNPADRGELDDHNPSARSRATPGLCRTVPETRDHNGASAGLRKPGGNHDHESPPRDRAHRWGCPIRGCARDRFCPTWSMSASPSDTASYRPE
jgi:hypothetical protein